MNGRSENRAMCEHFLANGTDLKRSQAR